MRNRTDQLSDAKLLYDFHAAAADDVTGEVVIAAGSHDLRVADHAASLFTPMVRAIVCSGGGGKVTSGIWARPEGTIFAERLRELGVPESAILIETEARNTGDNVQLSRDLLESRRIPSPSITLVCKPYMARRALATAEMQWPEPAWHISVPGISFEEYPSEDTPLNRMINLMVGDTQRLRTYAERGFQVPVDVPESIWLAYERLRDDGFNDFVLN